MPKRLFVFAATLAFASALSAQTQKFALTDTKALAATNAKVEAATYQGRKCVRVNVPGEDGAGLAMLTGTDFQDGVIEADIALKPNVPPGMRYPGFIGIAFRVRPDASHYELFYVRPGNSDAPDQLQRNHAIQYVSEPDFGWYRLRREWPALYESNAALAMEKWTALRIEVTGRAAKIFVNGATKPSLVVDGIRGEDLHGGVALWGYTNQENYFSNVRVTPATPTNVKNGSDAAGSWEMFCGTDAGGGPATMELHRDGNNLNGTFSGPFGQSRPITGTWRNGYVELSFDGEWPKESRQGTPGPVRVFLAGWIDGDSARGRLRVEARADGTWAAKRKT